MANSPDYIDLHMDAEERLRKLKVMGTASGVFSRAPVRTPNPIVEWLAYRSEVDLTTIPMSRAAWALADAERSTKGQLFHTAVRNVRCKAGVLPKMVDWNIQLAQYGAMQSFTLAPSGTGILSTYARRHTAPVLKYLRGTHQGHWVYPIWWPGQPDYGSSHWLGGAGGFSGKSNYQGYNSAIASGLVVEGTVESWITSASGWGMDWNGLEEGAGFPTGEEDHWADTVRDVPAPVDLFYFGIRGMESGWGYGNGPVNQTMLFVPRDSHGLQNGPSHYDVVGTYGAYIWTFQTGDSVVTFALDDQGKPVEFPLISVIVGVRSQGGQNVWYGSDNWPTGPANYYTQWEGELSHPKFAAVFPADLLVSHHCPIPYAEAVARGADVNDIRILTKERDDFYVPIDFVAPEYGDIDPALAEGAATSDTLVAKFINTVLGSARPFPKDYNHEWVTYNHVSQSTFSVITRHGWVHWKGDLPGDGIAVSSSLIGPKLRDGTFWFTTGRKPVGSAVDSQDEEDTGWETFEARIQANVSFASTTFMATKYDSGSGNWVNLAAGELADMTPVSYPIA